MGRRAGLPVIFRDAEHGEVWRYRFTALGRRERGSTGTRDYAEAQAIVSRLYSDALKGKRAKPERRFKGARSSKSLALLFAEFISEITDKKSKGYVVKLESHFRAHFDHRWDSLDAILEPGAIDKYAADRLAGKAPAVEHTVGNRKRRKRPDKASSVTVAKELVTLRQFLRWCKRRGHIEEMPHFERVKPISDYQPPDYTPEDARLLLSKLHNRKTHRRHCPVREFFTVQWSQGLRPGELESLRWQDVNLKRREMTVRQSEDKARVGRVLPISDEALAVLSALHKERSPLPSSPVFGITRYDRALTVAAKACKLPRPTRHNLRHFRLTEIGHSPGTSPAALQFFAGHKHLSTTDRYVRSRTQAARAMLDALPVVSRSGPQSKPSRRNRLPENDTAKRSSKRNR